MGSCRKPPRRRCVRPPSRSWPVFEREAMIRRRFSTLPVAILRVRFTSRVAGHEIAVRPDTTSAVQVAGAVAVMPRPAERRCRCALLGRGWERPPISACLDRRRGGWGRTAPFSSALRGRLSRPESPVCHGRTGRRGRKTLPRQRINGKASAHRRTAKVRIGPPCRLRVSVRL